MGWITSQTIILQGKPVLALLGGELAAKASDILTAPCHDCPQGERAHQGQREELRQTEASLLQMLRLEPTLPSLSWWICSSAGEWEAKGSSVPPEGRKTPGEQEHFPLLQRNTRLGICLEQGWATKTLNSHSDSPLPCGIHCLECAQ